MENKDSKGELKPCPFEKVEKDFPHELSIGKSDDSHDMFRVGCQCGARGPVMGFDKQSAIDGWNIRSIEAEAPAKGPMDPAMWLEENNISGDTMVNLDHYVEKGKEGAVYLHDLLGGYLKEFGSQGQAPRGEKRREAGWISSRYKPKRNGKHWVHFMYDGSAEVDSLVFDGDDWLIEGVKVSDHDNIAVEILEFLELPLPSPPPPKKKGPSPFGDCVVCEVGLNSVLNEGQDPYLVCGNSECTAFGVQIKTHKAGEEG